MSKTPKAPRPPLPKGVAPKPRSSSSSKKPKGSIRDLTNRDPQNDEEHSAIYATLSDGHPIVRAILGQAFVEYELDRLLKTRFKKNTDEKWRELTKDGGPFSTFYAKIIAGYAYEFYDKHTKDHLNRIRNIRNAFAHAKVILSFDDELIVEEIRRASIPSATHSQLFKDVKRIISPRINPDEAFNRLCLAVWTVLIRRNIRGVKASGSNYKRTSERLRKANPYGFGLMTRAQGRYQGGLAPPYPGNQTFDPTPLTLEQVGQMFGGQPESEDHS